MLRSKGKAGSLIDIYVGNLKREKDMVRLGEVHGWMSARYAEAGSQTMPFPKFHFD